MTVDLLTTAQALGIGRSMAYELARTNAYPIPLYRVGQRYRATRADLLRALGVTDDLPAAIGHTVAVPHSREAGDPTLSTASGPGSGAERRGGGAWRAAA